VNSLLQTLGPWHWLLLGMVLLIAETLLPGTFLVWFGVGAAVTGGLLLLVPTLVWQAQWVVFAALSLGSVVVWRRYRKSHPDRDDHPTLNRRGHSYEGRRFTLSTPIIDGVGKLPVDGSSWKITGPDLPIGTVVIVTGADGTILKVEPAE
jgi:membrane protein implicated in regulation of membrane protease activity